MEAAENLVLAPFRGIVDQGKRATANAHDSIAMLHALQSLVTEVEISLGLLEALCGKLIAAYGANFDDALKEHGTWPSHHPTDYALAGIQAYTRNGG